MQLEPFRLERFFAEHEFSVPYLLSSSDCEALAVGDLLRLEPEAKAALHELWLGYTESPGHPGLRQAIAAQYDHIQPDQVLVHSGAEEAIFNFVNACLQPGDHVIVHWPCYQSLFEVARAAGCRVTRWIAREGKGWALDLDELRASLRPNTRAVVLNCPHNPTGWLMPQDEWLELDRLARQHGFVVFSDEVYRLLEYDQADRLPPFCDLNERAVSLGVMSKSYGLAGLRIGWIATRNDEVYRRMAAFKDYTTICNSAPAELLATLALRHGEAVVGRNRQLIRRNLALLDEFFARHCDRFRWQRPQAGPIAFPALAGDEPAEPFCRRLIEDAGVLLLPGAVYGDDYGQHFRVGFGRQSLPEAVARLEAFLANTSQLWSNSIQTSP